MLLRINTNWSEIEILTMKQWWNFLQTTLQMLLDIGLCFLYGVFIDKDRFQFLTQTQK